MAEGKKNFAIQIKNVLHGDEYTTPQDAVDMIVPYVLRGGVQNCLVSVRYVGQPVRKNLPGAWT